MSTATEPQRGRAARAVPPPLVVLLAAAVGCYCGGAAVPSAPAIPRACMPPHDAYPFCNASKSLDERLDDLIGRLALAEKPFLLVARESPRGNISRLGIPEYDWGGNCVHGVQSRCGPNGRCPTDFPNPNALGQTFNRSVWRAMGAAIGIELRSLWLQGVGESHDPGLPHIGLDCWSPNVEIQRDPRWGRNMETPGEDPVVCGQFGAEYSLGLQNGTADPRYLQAVSTIKHFVANSFEGTYNGLTRLNINVNVSEFDLSSSYLPPFKTSVVEGGALGAMCSYNAVNGIPMCANKKLLDRLRSWGFDGYITSDSGAILDIDAQHNYTQNGLDTVAAAVKAGCDVESASWLFHPWATGGLFIDYMVDDVNAGLITEAEIDKSLRHALALRFRLGLFDPIEDQPYWHVPPDVVGSPEHLALAQDAAAQGMVLLRNPGGAILPFPVGKDTAIIGPFGSNKKALLGDYLGQLCADAYDSVECVATVVDRVQALNVGGKTVNVTACDPNSTSTEHFPAAIQAANASAQVILMMGLDGSLEGEGHDRYDITLPPIQRQLALAVLALGKPTVLVLYHGGAIALGDDLLSSNRTNLAIVSAGYPGAQGSEAVAEAVFGRTNRWGKLAATWYKADFMADFSVIDFDMTKAPGRTYRYYTKTPNFRFGHGLSYTKFELAAASSNGNVGRDGALPATFAVNVTNTGERDGDEVVLAFVQPAAGTIPANETASKLQRQLFDFQRVSVPRGGSATVTFALSADVLALFDNQGQATVFPGAYTLVFSNGVDQAVRLSVTVP